jgi:hypothetical protein
MNKQLQAVDFGTKAEHEWYAILRQSIGSAMDTTKFVAHMDELRSVAPQETLDWFKQYVRLATEEDVSEEEEEAFPWDHTEHFGNGTLNEAIVAAFIAEEELLSAKTFLDVMSLGRDGGTGFPSFVYFTENW